MTILNSDTFDLVEAETLPNFTNLKIVLDKIIKDMTAYITELTILDDHSYKKLTNVYKDAREWKKIIEESRKKLVEPLRKQTSFINDKAKDLTDPLDEVIAITNSKTEGYMKLLQQRKVEEEKRIKEAAALFDIEEDEIYIKPVDKSLRGEGAIASTTIKKKFRITDLDKVPRKYLAINEKAIEQDIKLGVGAIEGIEIYEETSTTLRVR